MEKKKQKKTKPNNIISARRCIARQPRYQPQRTAEQMSRPNVNGNISGGENRELEMRRFQYRNPSETENSLQRTLNKQVFSFCVFLFGA